MDRGRTGQWTFKLIFFIKKFTPEGAGVRVRHHESIISDLLFMNMGERKLS